MISPLLWQNWSIPHSRPVSCPLFWNSRQSAPFSRVVSSLLLLNIALFQSLLPLVNKLLKKLLIFNYEDTWRSLLLSLKKFASRQHHSTEDALVYATNNFLMAKDQGLNIGLVFVDMSKAFDRVQHQTLINDLREVGVRGSALKWFASIPNWSAAAGDMRDLHQFPPRLAAMAFHKEMFSDHSY